MVSFIPLVPQKCIFFMISCLSQPFSHFVPFIFPTKTSPFGPFQTLLPLLPLIFQNYIIPPNTPRNTCAVAATVIHPSSAAIHTNFHTSKHSNICDSSPSRLERRTVDGHIFFQCLGHVFLFLQTNFRTTSKRFGGVKKCRRKILRRLCLFQNFLLMLENILNCSKSSNTP